MSVVIDREMVHKKWYFRPFRPVILSREEIVGFQEYAVGLNQRLYSECMRGIIARGEFRVTPYIVPKPARPVFGKDYIDGH